MEETCKHSALLLSNTGQVEESAWGCLPGRGLLDCSGPGLYASPRKAICVPVGMCKGRNRVLQESVGRSCKAYGREDVLGASSSSFESFSQGGIRQPLGTAYGTFLTGAGASPTTPSRVPTSTGRGLAGWCLVYTGARRLGASAPNDQHLPGPRGS